MFEKYFILLLETFVTTAVVLIVLNYLRKKDFFKSKKLVFVGKESLSFVYVSGFFGLIFLILSLIYSINLLSLFLVLIILITVLLLRLKQYKFSAYLLVISGIFAVMWGIVIANDALVDGHDNIWFAYWPILTAIAMITTGGLIENIVKDEEMMKLKPKKLSESLKNSGFSKTEIEAIEDYKNKKTDD